MLTGNSIIIMHIELGYVFSEFCKKSRISK